MEPENDLFEKAIILQNLTFGLHINFQGVYGHSLIFQV